MFPVFSTNYLNIAFKYNFYKVLATLDNKAEWYETVPYLFSHYPGVKISTYEVSVDVAWQPETPSVKTAIGVINLYGALFEKGAV